MGETHFPLPLQGKLERLHLYLWAAEEEEYVAKKFDDQRNGHDATLLEYDIMTFWYNQIVQYLGRANAFLLGAKTAGSEGDREAHDMMLFSAKQAIAKCFMTAKGLAESSIRVYGRLPQPGVPSGEINEW